MINDNELISVKEAAGMLRLAEKTIRNKLSAGTFSSTKIFGSRRLYKKEIIELIKKGHREKFE